MAEVRDADIQGIRLVLLSPHADERGRLIETFRQEWLDPSASAMIQGNRSDSVRGTLRGLHYHLQQSDYWYAPAGRIMVALHDLRRSSASYGLSMAFEIGDGAEMGVYIPPGIAHGFQAITDATLTYLVDRYYDPEDEHGLAWDDPDAGIPWAILPPLLSPRDEANPKRTDIPEGALPA